MLTKRVPSNLVSVTLTMIEKTTIDGAVRALRYKEATSLMSGPDVAEVQKALKALNYFQGECDGMYGLETADAVLAFQRDHGMIPTTSRARRRGRSF